MFEFLRRHNKKAVSDAGKEELVSMGKRCLDIVSSSGHYSSIGFDEVRQKYANRYGAVSDEKLASALELLAKNRLVGFGGSVGNDVCFSRRSVLGNVAYLE